MSLQKRLEIAREVGKSNFLRLSTPAIRNEYDSYQIEFRLTRGLFWGLELRKGEYLAHYLRTIDSCTFLHKEDWTPSKQLALLAYAFPLIDHLTYHHKLYVREEVLNRIHRLTVDPTGFTARRVLAILYADVNCGLLRELFSE